MFSMLDAKLYPQGSITGYQADGSLWSMSNPNFDDTFFYIGVLPDTEVMLHVPFPVPTTLKFESWFESRESDRPLRKRRPLE